MNAKLFQIRLLKRVLKCGKKGVLDRDQRRKPDSRTCERKALSEHDSCMCILEMRAEAMHGSISADCAVLSRNKIFPRSAQILIVIGKAFAMHVNAHSSNHDPNHVLKHLSERDSFSCEHGHYLTTIYYNFLNCRLRNRRVLMLFKDVPLRTRRRLSR